MTEARKGQKSENKTTEDSECENARTKIMKTCLKLLFPFYKKVGQYIRKEKKVAYTNCRCEPQVNDGCCDGKLKEVSSRFHYHRGIASNAMLDKYDVCEKNVKVSLINGILNKCKLRQCVDKVRL